jgi:ABC-2 type transport system ATP-binding protein
MSDWAAELREVSISFGRVQAVKKVSLTIERGEVFGLLGPNGSGKTTLIRGLCGLVPLSGGSAELLGLNVRTQTEDIRMRVGYMSQKFSLYGDLTAQENISFYAGVYGLDADEAKTRQDELVSLTGLKPYLDRRAAKLSGGWKQRLAMVCALIHRPEIVFLDEPTAGVDPVARRDLWDLLFELSAEGITLVVTTHYMDEAERCARVGYLYLGDLLALGTPDELKNWPGVSPPGTRRWEITGSGSGATVSRLMEILRNCKGVREATIFGQTVRILADADVDPATLPLQGGSARTTEPSLEDVFVSLSRQRAAWEQSNQ